MSSTNRGGAKRRAADFYPTPAWVVKLLLRILKLPAGYWLEPSAGTGSLMRAVDDERDDVHWTAIELREECEQEIRASIGFINGEEPRVLIGDFTTMELDDIEEIERFSVAILNPPFESALEFVKRCLPLADYVVVLERTTWLTDSEERRVFFSQLKPDEYRVGRIDFTGDGGDSTTYSWFVWGPGDRCRSEGTYCQLPTVPPEEREGAPPRKPRPSMTPLAKAALKYAELGIPIFPLVEKGKEPLTTHGFKDASADPDVVKAWWKRNPNANIGVPMGARSGRLVVDIDPRNGGDDAWLSLCAAHDEPKTRAVRTGGGGLHLFFEHPGKGVPLKKTLAPGIDLQGDGKYIVAPPSVHPNGTTYKLLDPKTPIAPLPAWLRELVARPVTVSRPATTASPQRTGTNTREKKYAHAALLGEEKVVEAAGPGARNDTLVKSAFKIGTLVKGGHLDETEAGNALIDAALRAGLPEDEARKTVKKGFTKAFKDGTPRVIPPPSVAPSDDTAAAALALLAGKNKVASEEPAKMPVQRSSARSLVAHIESALKAKNFASAADAAEDLRRLSPEMRRGHDSDEILRRIFAAEEAHRRQASRGAAADTSPGAPRDASPTPATATPVHAASPPFASMPPAPPPPIVVAHDSETAISRALLSRLRGTGPELVYDRGELCRYDPVTGTWPALERDSLKREVMMFDGALVGDKRLRLSHNQTVGVINLAYASASHRGFFDQAPPGVQFANGFVTVDKEGIGIAPHAPEFRARAALPLDFDEHAPADRWLRFLEEIFAGDPDAAEKRALLQQFTAACFLGLATKYQKALVLLGGGENGKSVFLEVIQALFPPKTVTAIPPQDFHQEYRRALLSTSLLNAVSELPETDILASESLKAIVTGEAIMGRPIRESPFTFHPKAGHIFAANHLPATPDQSEGFWRRFMLVQFSRRFVGAAREKGLRDRIIRTELPGVAAWALQGGVDLLSRGDYQVPSSSDAALETWRHGADQVRQFAEDVLRWVEEPTTGGRLLYEEYSKWSRVNGHRALNNNKFAARLEAIELPGGVNRFTRTRDERGSFWNCDIR